MRTIRFHSYGEPADVLRLEDAEIPVPGAGRIRVKVQACGLNPADWACAGACSPPSCHAGSGWTWPGPWTQSAKA